MPEPTTTTRRNLMFALAPVLVFAAVAVLFAYALGSGDPSRLPSALIGKPVPVASFNALANLNRDGQPVPGFDADNLAAQNNSAAGDKKSRVRVVNFWASWCGPCITEHPQIETLGARDDVELFGVNYKDTSVNAHRYLNRYGNPYAVLGVDPIGNGAIEWGVAGMPETFVINTNGQIIYKHIGPITRQTLKTKILPAIEAAKRTK